MEFYDGREPTVRRTNAENCCRIAIRRCGITRNLYCRNPWRGVARRSGDQDGQRAAAGSRRRDDDPVPGDSVCAGAGGGAAVDAAFAHFPVDRNFPGDQVRQRVPAGGPAGQDQDYRRRRLPVPQCVRAARQKNFEAQRARGDGLDSRRRTEQGRRRATSIPRRWSRAAT